MFSLSVAGLRIFELIGSRAHQLPSQAGLTVLGRGGDQLWDLETFVVNTHHPSQHPQSHVYPQQQPRKGGLHWGSVRVPLFSRHGRRPPINGQPSAQPGLFLPWCSAVSTSRIPSRLREPESWWAWASGQTRRAEQVRKQTYVLLNGGESTIYWNITGAEATQWYGLTWS